MAKHTINIIDPHTNSHLAASAVPEAKGFGIGIKDGEFGSSAAIIFPEGVALRLAEFIAEHYGYTLTKKVVN